jgi:PTH1 family peptidyl-tRNA hydrolase
MSVRRLLVGLGNPGKKFSDTRHNVGFMVLDRLQIGYLKAATNKNSIIKNGPHDSLQYPTIDLSSQQSSLGLDLIDMTSERRRKKTEEEGFPFPLVDTTLLQPGSFMNRSGHETADVLRLNKFKLRKNAHSMNQMDEMLVIYDDISTPYGQLRMKPKGGHGGHNGIRDIIKRLGHDRFPRLKVGIGTGEGSSTMHVLEKFNGTEQKILPQILDFTCSILRVYLHRGFQAAARLANDPQYDVNAFLATRKKYAAARK